MPPGARAANRYRARTRFMLAHGHRTTEENRQIPGLVGTGAGERVRTKKWLEGERGRFHGELWLAGLPPKTHGRSGRRARRLSYHERPPTPLPSDGLGGASFEFTPHGHHGGRRAALISGRSPAPRSFQNRPPGGDLKPAKLPGPRASAAFARSNRNKKRGPVALTLKRPRAMGGPR